MEHKEKALTKILNILIKNRLNKIFEEYNSDLRILDITVNFHRNVNKFQRYKVNIVSNNNSIFPIRDEISYMILNASDYILTDTNYIHQILFFNEDHKNIDTDEIVSNGFRATDSRCIANIEKILYNSLMLKKGFPH
jgi:hypothetical protein